MMAEKFWFSILGKAVHVHDICSEEEIFLVSFTLKSLFKNLKYPFCIGNPEFKFLKVCCSVIGEKNLVWCLSTGLMGRLSLVSFLEDPNSGPWRVWLSLVSESQMASFTWWNTLWHDALKPKEFSHIRFF